MKYLKIGEFIFLNSARYRYTYQVVSNNVIAPDDVTAFQHEEKAYLALITCDNYDLQSGFYLARVAVRAKLVDIKAIP